MSQIITKRNKLSKKHVGKPNSAFKLQETYKNNESIKKIAKYTEQKTNYQSYQQ